jgi:hypothetical protein
MGTAISVGIGIALAVVAGLVAHWAITVTDELRAIRQLLERLADEE